MKLAEIILYIIFLSIPAGVLIYWFYIGFTKAGKEYFKKWHAEQCRRRREFYEMHKKYSGPEIEYSDWDDDEKYVDKDSYKSRRKGSALNSDYERSSECDCGDGSYY